MNYIVCCSQDKLRVLGVSLPAYTNIIIYFITCNLVVSFFCRQSRAGRIENLRISEIRLALFPGSTYVNDSDRNLQWRVLAGMRLKMWYTYEENLLHDCKKYRHMNNQRTTSPLTYIDVV